MNFLLCNGYILIICNDTVEIMLTVLGICIKSFIKWIKYISGEIYCIQDSFMSNMRISHINGIESHAWPSNHTKEKFSKYIFQQNVCGFFFRMFPYIMFPFLKAVDHNLLGWAIGYNSYFPDNGNLLTDKIWGANWMFCIYIEQIITDEKKPQAINKFLNCEWWPFNRNLI